MLLVVYPKRGRNNIKLVTWPCEYFTAAEITQLTIICMSFLFASSLCFQVSCLKSLLLKLLLQYLYVIASATIAMSKSLLFPHNSHHSQLNLLSIIASHSKYIIHHHSRLRNITKCTCVNTCHGMPSVILCTWLLFRCDVPSSFMNRLSPSA